MAQRQSESCNFSSSQEEDVLLESPRDRDRQRTSALGAARERHEGNDEERVIGTSISARTRSETHGRRFWAQKESP